MIRRALAVLLSLIPCAAVAAQSLSGTVVDTNGAPVNNVAIILSNGAPVGTTLPDGTFLITGLRDRTYTIQIDPHSNLLAAQQFDFNVVGASSLGTLVLQPAAPVVGVIHGPGGAGLLGVNMNVYLLDGTKLYTPHDGSDALGNISIAVPLTDVIIRAVPPVGSNLVPVEFQRTATGPLIDLGTVQLEPGYVVTGNVVRSGALPVGLAGAELRVFNQLTGANIVQLAKLSGVGGAFSLLVPFGLFEIDVLAPTVIPVTSRQIFGVYVNQSKSLGNVFVDPAVTISGTVVGPGGVPVAGADIDIFTSNGHKLFTPKDKTGPTGLFAVLVKPGSAYRVRIDPPLGSGLQGYIGPLTQVNAATSIGGVSLVLGVPVTVTVVDANSAPVAGAQLDLSNPATGEKVIVEHDVADATGTITAIVPSGSWNARITSPQGSTAASLSLGQLTLTAAQTIPVTLPTKTAYTNMTGIGPLTVPNVGGQILLNWSLGAFGPTPVPVTVEAVVALPSGTDVVLVPPLTGALFPGFILTLAMTVPVPPLPANELGYEQRFTVRFRDPVTHAILDEANIHYVAQ